MNEKFQLCIPLATNDNIKQATINYIVDVCDDWNDVHDVFDDVCFVTWNDYFLNRMKTIRWKD